MIGKKDMFELLFLNKNFEKNSYLFEVGSNNLLRQGTFCKKIY